MESGGDHLSVWVLVGFSCCERGVFGLAVALLWELCLLVLCSLQLEGMGFSPQRKYDETAIKTAFGRKHPREGSVSAAACDNSPGIREESRALGGSLANGAP